MQKIVYHLFPDATGWRRITITLLKSQSFETNSQLCNTFSGYQTMKALRTVQVHIGYFPNEEDTLRLCKLFALKSGYKVISD